MKKFGQLNTISYAKSKVDSTIDVKYNGLDFEAIFLIITLDNVKNVARTDRVVHHAKSHYDVFIARPTKWGNPIKLNDPMTLENSILLYGDDRRVGEIPTRDEVIVLYDNYLRHNEELKASLPELNGKILGCWCRPYRLCHGDAIINYMNELAIGEMFEY